MSLLDDRTTDRPARPGTGAGARPSPAQPAVPTTDATPSALRFVAVRAHLLPDEIIAGRRTDAMRRRVLVGLAALVAALVLAYGFSWWQTQSAQDDLSAAQQQQTALASETGKFGPLVRAKETTTTIRQQLQRLMVGDLPWRDMLTTLRTQAPAGVSLTQVAGTLTTAVTGATGGDTGDGGQQVLNRRGCTVVGPMTVTGTARDKSAVAEFADRLAAVKGLAAPLVTNIATAEGRTAFTLRVLVTTDALGGRYGAAPGTTCTKGD